MGNCVIVRRDQKSSPKFKWSIGSETVVNVPTGPNKAIVWEKDIGRLCSSPLSSPMNHVSELLVSVAVLFKVVDRRPPRPAFFLQFDRFAAVFNAGKGDETFFDSQAWLDSDNEDFFSVNGDNTPSCGSSPIWRPNTIETPTAEPSPKDEKKQLIELFRDSFNGEHGRSVANLSNRHDHMEVVNNQPISRRRSRSVKGKSAQPTPCCIPVPNLARSLSLGDKKKRLSPCRGGGRVDL